MANASPSLSSSSTTSSQVYRKQWLEQSILRRLIEPVKSVVDAMRSVSPLLQQPPPVECAVLARHEVLIRDVPLGQGGFSVVHEIVEIHLDGDVHARCTLVQQQLRTEMAQNLFQTDGTPRYVMKHLMRKLLNQPKLFQDALRDLALEVEYMGRISHEYILPLIAKPFDGLNSATQSFDGFFMITERLDLTLGQQIKEWNVSCENSSSSSSISLLEQRTRYLEQLAAAITYLHGRNIVFRDLKPDNVGIYQNQIRLFDFGLCRELPKRSESNDHDNNNSVEPTFAMSGVGTQRYMAVELLENRPYNLKVDVYSWALISWETMTGVRPYLRYGNAQHKQAVLQMDERPQLPTEWPLWLRTVLARSWCRDISQRNSMASALTMMQQARMDRIQPKALATVNHHHNTTTPAHLSKKRISTKMFLRERSFGRLSSNDNNNNVENQSTQLHPHMLKLSSVHWNSRLIFAS